MKYYIITGEASGDLHASNLMRELKINDTKADFRFWGGELMLSQGGFMVKHYKETAFMGFLTVLRNLSKIKSNFSLCEEDLLKYKPDVLLLVDYPGFNLRMAKFAKKHNIRVHYYISPKIWAWKESRIKKIKKYVDKMFTIFPFETEFYAKHKYKVHYCGNPLLDALERRANKNEELSCFLSRNSMPDKPIIALLAGSRKQEIDRILPIMLEMVDEYPNYQFVIAAAPSISEDYYEKIVGSSKVAFVYKQTYELLQQSTMALVASGTATLETALLKIPQVVCYKTSGGPLVLFLGKLLLKIKYISLVNLIVDKVLVKELIQQNLNSASLKKEMDNIISNSDYRNNMLAEYERLHTLLGSGGASARFAKLIVDDLRDNTKPDSVN